MMWHLILHLLGDYVTQSDWMASEKTKQSTAALAHAIVYSLPFIFLTWSWKAVLFIALTHFVIDRWRLIRYVCWAKNFMAPKWIELEFSESTLPPPMYMKLREKAKPAPGRLGALRIKIRNHPWKACQGTGYHSDKPPWMSVWLMIIADNCAHLICNEIALRWL